MFDMEYTRQNINDSYAESFEIITPVAIVPDNFLSSGLDCSWGQQSAGKKIKN